METDSSLFYTCSLIEYLGREKKLRRADVVHALGDKAVRRICRYADTLHSEPIARVADEYGGMYLPQAGSFDNVAACRYQVPDYWTVGKVYSRLIEDVNGEGDPLTTLEAVYASWISDAISNYNSDFYYQPREYLRECYLAGEVL